MYSGLLPLLYHWHGLRTDWCGCPSWAWHSDAPQPTPSQGTCCSGLSPGEVGLSLHSPLLDGSPGRACLLHPCPLCPARGPLDTPLSPSSVPGLDSPSSPRGQSSRPIVSSQAAPQLCRHRRGRPPRSPMPPGRPEWLCCSRAGRGARVGSDRLL